MRTPIKPLPDFVARWRTRARLLKIGDAAIAWIVVWMLVLLILDTAPLPTAVFALALVAAGTLVPAARVRWRPLSGAVGVAVSRQLRPGDRAWYVHGGEAELVLVTARHGIRLVIAIPHHEMAEGITVRATRVLLVPDELR